MSKASDKFYENFKKRIEKRRENYKARNKKQTSEQETKNFKTNSPTSFSDGESKQEHAQSMQQHKNKTLLKIKSFTIGLHQKIVRDVYFLKGGGLLDFVMFIGSSIVCFVLLALGIGIYILPLCFVLSILLLWIGLEIGGYIALVGLWVVVLGAFLSTILYFAQMNVRLYKEKHFGETDKSLCNSGEEK